MKEELHKLTFKQSEAEVEEIRNYVEWQGRGKEKVLHAEKLTSERIMGREYEVWDVHTDVERWCGHHEPDEFVFAKADAEHGLHLVLSHRADVTRRGAP